MTFSEFFLKFQTFKCLCVSTCLYACVHKRVYYISIRIHQDIANQVILWSALLAHLNGCGVTCDNLELYFHFPRYIVDYIGYSILF